MRHALSVSVCHLLKVVTQCVVLSKWQDQKCNEFGTSVYTAFWYDNVQKQTPSSTEGEISSGNTRGRYYQHYTLGVAAMRPLATSTVATCLLLKFSVISCRQRKAWTEYNITHWTLIFCYKLVPWPRFLSFSWYLALSRRQMSLPTSRRWWDVSYTSTVRWVETIRVPRAEGCWPPDGASAGNVDNQFK